MASSAALYQVAVALIPALLFGGAALQLREESPNLRGRPLAVFVVTVILLVGLVAEIVAIRGAIDPSLREIEQRYLILVMTLGTAAFAYWIAAPMIPRQKNERGILRGRIVIATVLGIVAVVGQFMITDSLQNAGDRNRYNEVAKVQFQAQRELRSAESADSAARVRLISMGRTTRSSDLAVRIVIGYLSHIDGDALGVSSTGQSIAKVNDWIRDASKNLADDDERFKRSVKDQLSDLDRGERELLLLAERQVRAAISAEMSSRISAGFAEQQFEGACEDLGLERCRPRVIRRGVIAPSAHARATGKSHSRPG